MIKTANTTYDAAIRNGAGVILTNGTDRWKVSDYSPSDKAVYGHRLHRLGGGHDGYAKLPPNLKVAK